MRSAARGAAVAALILAVGACGRSTRDVRVTVLDEAGHPVPGAVFYAEAFDAAGPFAFYSTVVGSAGGVPDDARQPLHLPWRPEAGIALAAFAPGYRPTVLRDPEGRVETDGIALALERPGAGGSAWNPAVAELGFPFPDDPALAAQAAHPEYAPLREALRSAWATRDTVKAPLTLAERRKIRALSVRD